MSMRHHRKPLRWPWPELAWLVLAAIAAKYKGPLLVIAGIWAFFYCWAQLSLRFPLTMAFFTGLFFGLFRR